MTQFDMKGVEKLGLIKFDFLGLKTLTVIDDASNGSEASRGVDVDIDAISLTDRRPTSSSRGDTPGVFQLESSGMKDLVMKLMPAKFEDDRRWWPSTGPGPLERGMVDDFIKTKARPGTPSPTSSRSSKPILNDTYGVIVYQEQVMQIANRLAGIQPRRRRPAAPGHGQEEAGGDGEARGSSFVDGAQDEQDRRQEGGEIFDLMAKFAGYGFNKSHSAAYALIAYQTAYLKAHYPVEFMAALLTSEMEDTDKILRYINECREMGIDVLPDVNESRASRVGDVIRFGLTAVKNVGRRPSSRSSPRGRRKGPFTSLFDFARRVDLRRVNKRVIESLIKCGAFESLGFSGPHSWRGWRKRWSGLRTWSGRRPTARSPCSGGSRTGDGRRNPVSRRPRLARKPAAGRGKGDPGFLPDRPSPERLRPYPAAVHFHGHPAGPGGGRGHGQEILIGGVVTS